jgi:hypothetical protein
MSRRKSEESKVVAFKINRNAAVDTSTQSDNAAYLKYYAEVSSYLRREEFDKLDNLAADYRPRRVGSLEELGRSITSILLYRSLARTPFLETPVSRHTSKH